MLIIGEFSTTIPHYTIMKTITGLFGLWAILFSAAAWFFPETFAAGRPAIVPLLGVVMFGMGMTLTVRDFQTVAARPGVVALGTAMQYLLMPFLAWAIAKAAGLEPYQAAGLIIVGSCPGGTASNVVCFLAKGDVALSITLTFVSTMLAVVFTPTLTWVYVGQTVPVPVLSMIGSVFKVVIIPVTLGVTINTLLGEKLKKLKPAFPVISVFAIVVIIGVIVGLNRDNIANMAAILAVCVMAHNLLGLAGGYWVAGLAGLSEKERRTIAIEVGMQNSGLGVTLAITYFSAAAALPGAIFSVWHNLAGSFLAGYWSRRAGG